MSEALTLRIEPLEELYDIGEEIGSGQFAVVKKCTEKCSGTEFAAKFMKKKRSKALKRGVTREQIAREAGVLRAVNHEGIIHLHDLYEAKTEFVLILELLSGGELFEFLSEQDYLTEDEAIGFLRQVIETIDYLHDKSIVHLDIKPENIVLKSRESLQVKLIDFGLAREITKGEAIREIMGTPEFVAPEIIGYEPIGLPTDLWAIGVLAYIMLSGLSPFLGEDNNETFSNITHVDYEFDDEYFKDISSPAKDFIASLLVNNPNDRMSASECLKHEWLQEVVTPIPKSGPTTSDAKKRRSTMIKTDAFKAFTARARWKKSLNKVIAVSRLALLGRKNGPLAKALLLQCNDSNSESSDPESTPNSTSPVEVEPPVDKNATEKMPGKMGTSKNSIKGSESNDSVIPAKVDEIQTSLTGICQTTTEQKAERLQGKVKMKAKTDLDLLIEDNVKKQDYAFEEEEAITREEEETKKKSLPLQNGESKREEAESEAIILNPSSISSNVKLSVISKKAELKSTGKRSKENESEATNSPRATHVETAKEEPESDLTSSNTKTKTYLGRITEKERELNNDHEFSNPMFESLKENNLKSRSRSSQHETSSEEKNKGQAPATVNCSNSTSASLYRENKSELETELDNALTSNKGDKITTNEDFKEWKTSASRGGDTDLEKTSKPSNNKDDSTTKIISKLLTEIEMERRWSSKEDDKYEHGTTASIKMTSSEAKAEKNVEKSGIEMERVKYRRMVGSMNKDKDSGGTIEDKRMALTITDDKETATKIDAWSVTVKKRHASDRKIDVDVSDKNTTSSENEVKKTLEQNEGEAVKTKRRIERKDEDSMLQKMLTSSIEETVSDTETQVSDLRTWRRLQRTISPEDERQKINVKATKIQREESPKPVDEIRTAEMDTGPLNKDEITSSSRSKAVTLVESEKDDKLKMPKYGERKKERVKVVKDDAVWIKRPTPQRTKNERLKGLPSPSARTEALKWENRGSEGAHFSTRLDWTKSETTSQSAQREDERLKVTSSKIGKETSENKETITTISFEFSAKEDIRNTSRSSLTMSQKIDKDILHNNDVRTTVSTSNENEAPKITLIEKIEEETPRIGLRVNKNSLKYNVMPGETSESLTRFQAGKLSNNNSPKVEISTAEIDGGTAQTKRNIMSTGRLGDSMEEEKELPKENSRELSSKSEKQGQNESVWVLRTEEEESRNVLTRLLKVSTSEANVLERRQQIERKPAHSEANAFVEREKRNRGFQRFTKIHRSRSEDLEGKIESEENQWSPGNASWRKHAPTIQMSPNKTAFDFEISESQIRLVDTYEVGGKSGIKKVEKHQEERRETRGAEWVPRSRLKSTETYKDDNYRVSRVDAICSGRRSKSAERLRGYRLESTSTEDKKKKKKSTPTIDARIRKKLTNTFAEARNKFS